MERYLTKLAAGPIFWRYAIFFSLLVRFSFEHSMMLQKISATRCGKMNNWELIDEEAQGTNNLKNYRNQLPILVDEIFIPHDLCSFCQHLSLLLTWKWRIYEKERTAYLEKTAFKANCIQKKKHGWKKATRWIKVWLRLVLASVLC